MPGSESYLSPLWKFLFVLGLGCFPGGMSNAADWPGWRGPSGLGYCEEKDLPLKWDAKTGENILWKAPLHGGAQRDQDMTSPGWSCPIVCKDRVFLTTAIFPGGLTREERKQAIATHHVLCFDANTGKELWDTVIPAGKLVTLVENIYHGYAVPTPATDGKHVYALFGSGVLACLAFDGKIVWREELPRLRDTDPGICSSPIVYEDLVIVPGLQDKGLRALDKATGKLRWEQDTKLRGTMATPAVLRIQDRPQLIHNCQGGVMGVEPRTGEILWTCRAPASQSSVVFGDGWLFVDAGRHGQKGVAIDPTGKGDVSKTHLKWEARIDSPAGSSAIIVAGHIYRACNQEFLRCFSLKDGTLVHEVKAPRLTPSASPIVTPDGRIYFAGPGRSHVISAKPQFDILGTNDLNDGENFTTPAIANGRLYIKGRSYLWCIGTRK